MKNLFLPVSVLLAWLFVESLAPNAAASNPRSLGDTNWIARGGYYGLNGSVNASVRDAAGNLYVGGSFTIAGNVSVTNIAKWDGTNWSALGSGLNGMVRTLTVSGNAVYAGGDFTAAGANIVDYVAKWDGTNWSDLGGGLGGSVFALQFYNGSLYAGGTYADISGHHLFAWDGTSWSSPLGGVDGPVFALAVMNGSLYVGGNFTYSSVGATALHSLGRWDGSSWSEVAGGVNGSVQALTPFGTDLFVGGAFTNVFQYNPGFGNYAANNIVRYDSTTNLFFRMDLGSSLDGTVDSIAVLGNDLIYGRLIVGGEFQSANGTPANFIAAWHFLTTTFGDWSALGSGMNSYALTLCASGNTLYAGGDFTTAGGINANFLASWNSTNWTALTSTGLNGEVSALLAVNPAALGAFLFAAGDFTEADGNQVNYIAGWNGTNWTPLGPGNPGNPGVNGPVSALATDTQNLFAGGEFTTAGGVAASNVAEYDGYNWQPLGLGTDGPVAALASTIGENSYAGGTFSHAGGVPVNNIARWNSFSSSWFDVGGGVNNDVACLLLLGNPYNPPISLYAGGDFTTAGTNAANRIARWDGTNWFSLGPGLNSTVLALAASSNTIYAGGYFSMAGTTAVNHVAKWDGTNWTALGGGVNAPVFTLTVWGNDLYAGGIFVRSGTNVINYIAKWDGTNWLALGSGMNTDSYVNSLLVGSDGYFYAGGYFTTAGHKVSPNIVRAPIADPGSFLSASTFFSYYSGSTDFGMQFSATPGVAYTIEYTPTLSPPQWQSLGQNLLMPATDVGLGVGVVGLDVGPATNSTGFYRSVWPAQY